MTTYLRYPAKVAIVTGGTRGIGLAIVREFVRQGAKVVFCSRACGAERGQAIQRELQDSGCPGEAFYQVCDVRNESDIQRLILVTIECYGCLDCLVNNAGDFETETIDDVTAQDFCNIMELNVVSCLLTSKYSLPYLRKTRGNIINVSSLYGVIGGKNLLSYNASKGAVIALTKALAIDESKYGVRVNSITPSNIWTSLWERYANQSPDPEAKIQEGQAYQLMGRFGTPEEVALGVLYLAADGTFCTGFNLLVTGGAEVGFGMKSEVDPQPGPWASRSSQDSSRKFLLVAIERYGCLDCLVNNAGDEKLRQMASMATCLRYPGKVVIVTGGTRGIGLAIVTEFVRQGAKVVFCSRASGAERGQEIQRRLQDSGCPGEAFYQVCDVRNEADIQRLILVTIERYGCLDCLVNNVGTVDSTPIENVTAEDFRNLMETNVVSCLLTSKYALPYLRETRGNIINIGSLAGVIGAKNCLAYAPSKGAVIAMTKALAIDESKCGVRVNCVSPGNIWSPLWEKYVSLTPDPQAVIQAAQKQQLMGRYGTPKEVALGVLYLAAEGTFCTGFDLVISGGAEVGFGTKSEVDPQPGPSVKGISKDSSRKK
ncbi:uncharacterized protein LOC129339513 [Eublepharis macularius]|uniref:Uncharacterized protein LOC129339513 n=1 Tax=Eublepharis macularius TaxID=481883 RepID=A0AA97LBX5_EUBMA|nr:uncharacterized protein LOC129339513 [Eublepharis macularius]